MPALVSKTGFVYQDLRERIFEGEFPDSSCLPTERQFMEHYGISRTIVRLSLGKLEEEGLICRRKGSGTYITEGAREKLQSTIKSQGMLKVAFVFALGQVGNHVFSEIMKSFSATIPANVIPEVHFDVMPHFDKYFEKGADLVFIEGRMLETHPVIPAEYRGRVVLLNRSNERYSFVCTDNYIGGRMMVEELLDKGHEKIGVIHYGTRADQEFCQRLQGMWAVFDENSIEPAVEVEININDYQSLNPHEASMQVLAHESKITAAILITDGFAVPFYNVAEQMGLRIPDDISVIALDDLPTSRFLAPPLTTVRQPLSEISVKLASVVQDYSKGNKPFCALKISPRLIIRESIKNIF